MKIDTKEIEHDFDTLNVDGLILTNPREIGITVAYEMLDNDIIWESDIYNKVYEILDDIIETAVNTAYDVLEENRDDIV